MGRTNRHERDVIEKTRWTNVSENPIAKPIEIRSLFAEAVRPSTSLENATESPYSSWPA